jgi:hypothetical protein
MKNVQAKFFLLFKCWSGSLSAFDLMRFVWRFRFETDTYVWIILLDNLKTLSGCLLNSSFYNEFRVFVKKLIENVVKRLGYQVNNGEGLFLYSFIESFNFFIFWIWSHSKNKTI